MGTDPYANKQHSGDPQAGIGLFKQVILATGGLVGVVAMVVGLVYAGKMLKLLFDFLSSPEGAQPVRDLAEMLGGAELAMPTAAGSVPLAMPLAVALLIVALLVIGWLALGLITTGAKVVSFCLSDRESIKELLAQALGLKKKNENKEKGGTRP